MKITEEDIKEAFRQALVNNIDRLYEDFKSRFSNISRQHTLPPSYKVKEPLSLEKEPTRKRIASTKNGLNTLYHRYLSGENATRWARSEQYYVCLAFSTDNPWKKAIHLVLALDAMNRKYTSKSPIQINQHGVLEAAVKDLQKIIEALLQCDENAAPTSIIERIDYAAIEFIDALLLFNQDCRKRDTRWPARYAPTYPGQKLLSLSRDGEKIADDRELFKDNEPSKSKELQERGAKRLQALGL